MDYKAPLYMLNLKETNRFFHRNSFDYSLICMLILLFQTGMLYQCLINPKYFYQLILLGRSSVNALLNKSLYFVHIFHDRRIHLKKYNLNFPKSFSLSRSDSTYRYLTDSLLQLLSEQSPDIYFNLLCKE